MNKNKLILALFSILFLCSFALDKDITEFQKQQVRKIADTYINLLARYANDPNNNPNQPILDLFVNNNVYVYDDLTNENKMFINVYLDNIEVKKYYPLNISLSNNLNSTDVIAKSKPNFSKTDEKSFAQIQIIKKISGKKINKTVSNYLLIDLNTYKIFGISGETEINPLDLWLKGTDYYNKEQYADALLWYEKSANMGYRDAYYSLAIMKLKGIGCKKNSKDGIRLLKIAKNKGDENAAELLLKIEN